MSQEIVKKGEGVNLPLPSFKVKLLSYPLVNLSLLPLELNYPIVENCGGYVTPRFRGNDVITEYAYSPIDLLVAGLDGLVNNFTVKGSLSDYFVRRYRAINSNILVVEYSALLNILVKNTQCEAYPVVHTVSIGLIKTQIINRIAYWEALLELMKKEAPLVFQWIK